MTRFETVWASDDAYTSSLGSVAERLQGPRVDGLVQVDGARCRVTDAGRPFLRNICMAFDERLARGSEAARQFSRTV
jgi:oxygen-independent coproporphyrinogen-3 oxidase